MQHNQLEKSPYLLENDSEYATWRKLKLQAWSERKFLQPWTLNRDQQFNFADLKRIQAQVGLCNFFIFKSASLLSKREFVALNRQLGLTSLDSNPGADADKVTSLQVVGSSDERAQYIPYTNRALNWHTDGYYNDTDRTIRAFSLYCVNQAERGGGNFLFDHELMYLLIRDIDPELVATLMDPQIMTIPANVSGGEIIRSQATCSVFSIHPYSGRLQMRFTSRPRNIVWRDDKRSERALNLIREILMDHGAVTEVRLAPGEGLVCNNVLHGRQAFTDGSDQSARLIYRARYYEFIQSGDKVSSGAAA